MKCFRLGRRLSNESTTLVFAGVVRANDVKEAIKLTHGFHINLQGEEFAWWSVDEVTRRWCIEGRMVDRTNVGYDPAQFWSGATQTELAECIQNPAYNCILRSTQEGDVLQPCDEDGVPLQSEVFSAYVVYPTSTPLVVFAEALEIVEYTEI